MKLVSLRDNGYRFYCGDGVCTWRKPVIKEARFPYHIDCTEMNDSEFEDFLLNGGDKITKGE